jgi:hypothetical protein
VEDDAVESSLDQTVPSLSGEEEKLSTMQTDLLATELNAKRIEQVLQCVRICDESDPIMKLSDEQRHEMQSILSKSREFLHARSYRITRHITG